MKPKSRKTWVYVLAGAVPAAALISLFIYVMSRALGDMGSPVSGRRVAELCMSRISKAAQAQLMYAADHDDGLPDAKKWVDLTWAYVEKKDPKEVNESVFRCPAISILREQGFGYGFNERLGFLKISQAENPSESLVFDASDLARNAHGAPADLLPQPMRHNGGRNNIEAGLDGSVRTLADE